MSRAFALLLVALLGAASPAVATNGDIAAVIQAAKDAILAKYSGSGSGGAGTAGSRFVGPIKCYVDPDTGYVAGIQFGSAPVVCTSTSIAVDIDVAADEYIGNLKAVTTKDDRLGKLIFTTYSAAGIPSDIASCGLGVGIPIDILPKGTALSSFNAGCSSSAGKRRLLQAGLLNVTSIKVTSSLPTAPGNSTLGR